jgi:hypothetical protein
VHVERSGIVHLEMTPEEALPLFTPEGERAWVPGWEPEPLHAVEGSLSRAGAVFRTAAAGEETLWITLRVDPAVGEADYVRITPGNRLGTVHVRCRRAAEGTDVEMTYRLTALSPAGEAALAAMTPEAFADELAGWRCAIGVVAARSR